ncbi:class I SAM-dependent methyltransferase [Lysobacter sp. HDW10]|uniref:class I SAM-dependent DNA methyltransferase n=1 Tax=Lysobacter sp. HDW10 TaxID=2714936 RepID=UPI00140770D3|nr:class I SAM-dependent methyltransferase [Lysobacter sp. HDW10]QIK81386.1 class I SAM-dependent methyltransferase [Lysobacter sp. HDW10]
MRNSPKIYDQKYFDRWYRGRTIGTRAEVERLVTLAVATAEYHLERPIHSVLDIGCGEGPWQPILKRLRPKARYMGFDSSEYAVRKFGARRNIHFARFADFEMLRPCPPADLVVCSDVLHYLTPREIDRGLPGLVELTGGILCLPTFVRGDALEGDFHDFHQRPASFYTRRLEALGMQALGNHCWIDADHPLTGLEKR